MQKKTESWKRVCGQQLHFIAIDFNRILTQTGFNR